MGCINVGGDLDNFHLFQGSVSESQLFFSNGPDDVGRWQRATFKFFFSSGDLYWIGSDKSCSTLIARHKLGAVHVHVYWPLMKLLEHRCAEAKLSPPNP